MDNDIAKALLWPSDGTLPEGENLLAAVPYDAALGRAGAAAAWQHSRLRALPFIAAGWDVRTDAPDGADYDRALVAPGKQREDARALMAGAALCLRPGGVLVAAAPNDAGGRRIADDLRALGMDVATDSKYHCRIAVARAEGLDRAAAQACVAESGARAMTIGDETLWTQPGIFGWDKFDAGTALLLRHLPRGAAGRVADLGCGTGILMRHILRHNPDVVSVIGVDEDARAVAAARRNAEDPRAAVIWGAVGAEDDAARDLDAVVMNPPFHQAHEIAVGAGIAFIGAAARMLRPGGALWMVANAHLPYEAALAQHFSSHDKIAEENGFKIYRAVK